MDSTETTTRRSRQRANGESSLIEIVIPTVTGREAWLKKALGAISQQIENNPISVRVSGNGTQSISQKIAEAHGASYDHYESELAAWEHLFQIVTKANSPFLWIVADDDILHERAIEIVRDAISATPGTLPDAIIGRARLFSRSDLSDLGDPDPIDTSWQPGLYRDLASVGRATLGSLHFGSFVFRTELLDSEDLRRFGYTFHSIFAAFWLGLGRRDSLAITVVSDPLVMVRESRKTWQEDQIPALWGLQQYNKLIPSEIGLHRLASPRHLTRRKALQFSSNCQPAQRRQLRDLVQTYSTFDKGAKLASILPRIVAQALIWVQARLKQTIDGAYVRVFGARKNAARSVDSG